MGNGVGKLNLCFAGDAGEISRRRHDITVYLSHPLDEGLGHSFCYFHPSQLTSSDDYSSTANITTAFKSISGASLSANTSTPLSIDLCSLNSSLDKASSFESSDSFAAIPLQPVPRNLISAVRSGPIPSSPGVVSGSGPIERGFLSGPIERSFISGPLENHHYDHLQRYKPTSRKWNLIRNFRRTIANSIREVFSGKFSDSSSGMAKNNDNFCVINNNLSSQVSLAGDGDECPENSLNVQWAQGKAGEDRVHIVTSEEHGWVFVGIYDGFNGPDATDYLLNNLYSNVHKELKGLLWNDSVSVVQNHEHHLFDNFPESSGKDNVSSPHGNSEMDSDQRVKRQKKLKNSDGGSNHKDVLKALSEALRKTEESFLEIADLMLMENPELSLMGSCVLVMLMKGEDVYLMNVGDSRAVLAQKDEHDLGMSKAFPELRRINEETANDVEPFHGDEFDRFMKLTSVQLTMDHSTSVEEEVKRIKKEHPDDSSAIANDRVKGSLKVTRAFGAGFLKQPKWNNALLKMFRIDYVGSSPYITCSPSVYHHRLVQKDRFLILSSDGLYQYFTNEEAISEVDKFISRFPEGDPAQHLIEEVLFRAANKAGMDFHELLEIPQGDRRRYHDDVSVIIISFEGRIWRSSM